MAFWQPFTGSQIERNARPTPVVQFRPDGDEGFCRTVDIGPVFFEVARHFLATNRPFAVLAAHGGCVDVAVIDWHQRLEHFDLFIAHRVLIKDIGRFHRDQAQKLQHMVLHHVAHCTGIVIIGPAAFGTDFFADRDLHVVNMRAVPKWFKHRIGKAQNHKVLHCFLAKVMVDTENLVFVEDFTNLAVDFTATIQIVAQRLFKHNAGIWRYQTNLFKVKGHIGKQGRTGRKIINPVAIRLIGEFFVKNLKPGFVAG